MTPEPDVPSVTSVHKRRSRAGLGYSTNVIHETSRSRTLFLAWYIEHDSGEHRLAGKLVRQQGKPGSAPASWSETASFSLDADEVSALYQALEEHAVVARERGEGEILIIRGKGKMVAAASAAGPGEVVGAVLKLLSRRDVLDSFARENLGDEIITALQRSIRLQELGRAIQELREHLEGGEALESVYQDWCTKHTWAFGNAHTQPDDLRVISRTDSVDLLLPRVLTGHRDVVELKRPDHPVMWLDKGHGSWYWSSETAKAIGQCHQYMDHLHEDAQHGLRGRFDLIAYHPQATIVIGRSTDWQPEAYKGLAGLNERLSGIAVMTYDQLLAQGEELLRVLGDEVAG